MSTFRFHLLTCARGTADVDQHIVTEAEDAAEAMDRACRKARITHRVNTGTTGDVTVQLFMPTSPARAAVSRAGSPRGSHT